MSFGFSAGDILLVLDLARRTRQRWKEVPGEYATLGKEIKSLESLLEHISKSREEQYQATSRTTLDGIVDQCKAVLTTANKIADEYSTTSSNSFKQTFKRLKADPVDVRHVRDQLVSVIAQLNTIQNAVQNNGIQTIKENQDITKKVRIADWYSSPTFAQDQDRQFSLRHSGTVTWILRHPVYANWRDSPRQVLFCTGIPGAGKSVTFATIVDDLRNYIREDPGKVVAYFYCDYKRKDEQILPLILSALARQLFQEQDTIPPEVLDLYEKHVHRASRPSIEELEPLIESLTALYSEVFLLVDALDECNNEDVHHTRNSIISYLMLLQKKDNANINILATGRPDVLQHFRDCPRIEIKAQSEDVTAYLEAKVAETVVCIARHPDLQMKVIEVITSAADGMRDRFLLARLHLESLQNQTKPREVLRVLRDLPQGSVSVALDIAYGGVLDRIDQQSKEQRILAQKTLMWVTFAFEVLTMRELQEALAIEPDLEDIDPDLDFDDENIIIQVCAGLVAVDPENGLVKLTHATTQVYLEKTKHRWLSNGVQDIAHRCFMYLSMKTFYEDGVNWRKNPINVSDGYALLPYVSRHWGFHLRELEAVPIYLKSAIAEKEFQCFAAQLTFSIETTPHYMFFNFARDIPSLHIFARFDCKVILQSLLEEGHDPSSVDSRGDTALHVAARHGYVTITSILLAQEGSDRYLNIRGHRGTTALLIAACYGRTEIVAQLLAEKDIGPSVNLLDSKHNTPLLMAAGRGHSEVVAQLLAREDIRASVNLQNMMKDTPLLVAARSGHSEIVAQLLARKDIKMSVNLQNWSAHTPLSLAASKGHSEIVTQLLAREDIIVSVNLQDGYDQTPLSAAAWYGSRNIVAQLLARPDISTSINLPDQRGDTPLSIAAEFGHSEIVAQLLARQDIDLSVNLQNILGDTPLSLAAQHGHGDIVTQLFVREDISTSVNLQDEQGRTPLSKAAHIGKSKLVAQFLARKDISTSVNLQDERGYTPLSVAVWNSYSKVVDLDEMEIMYESKVRRGKYVNIVAQLLAREDIHPSMTLLDTHGNSLKYFADRGSFEAAVNDLLIRWYSSHAYDDGVTSIDVARRA